MKIYSERSRISQLKVSFSRFFSEAKEKKLDLPRHTTDKLKALPGLWSTIENTTGALIVLSISVSDKLMCMSLINFIVIDIT